ncbi:hypothetical protein HDV00_004838 [Rhizophlyctis rosea]|nr:hypothetical protein HDV00_004838 [Rhizophlyctis rosea]
MSSTRSSSQTPIPSYIPHSQSPTHDADEDDDMMDYLPTIVEILEYTMDTHEGLLCRVRYDDGSESWESEGSVRDRAPLLLEAFFGRTRDAQVCFWVGRDFWPIDWGLGDDGIHDGRGEDEEEEEIYSGGDEIFDDYNLDFFDDDDDDDDDEEVEEEEFLETGMVRVKVEPVSIEASPASHSHVCVLSLGWLVGRANLAQVRKCARAHGLLAANSEHVRAAYSILAAPMPDMEPWKGEREGGGGRGARGTDWLELVGVVVGWDGIGCGSWLGLLEPPPIATPVQILTYSPSAHPRDRSRSRSISPSPTLASHIRNKRKNPPQSKHSSPPKRARIDSNAPSPDDTDKLPKFKKRSSVVVPDVVGSSPSPVKGGESESPVRGQKERDSHREKQQEKPKSNEESKQEQDIYLEAKAAAEALFAKRNRERAEERERKMSGASTGSGASFAVPAPPTTTTTTTRPTMGYRSRDVGGSASAGGDGKAGTGRKVSFEDEVGRGGDDGGWSAGGSGVGVGGEVREKGSVEKGGERGGEGKKWPVFRFYKPPQTHIANIILILIQRPPPTDEAKWYNLLSTNTPNPALTLTHTLPLARAGSVVEGLRKEGKAAVFATRVWGGGVGEGVSEGGGEWSWGVWGVGGWLRVKGRVGLLQTPHATLFLFPTPYPPPSAPSSPLTTILGINLDHKNLTPFYIVVISNSDASVPPNILSAQNAIKVEVRRDLNIGGRGEGVFKERRWEMANVETGKGGEMMRWRGEVLWRFWGVGDEARKFLSGKRVHVAGPEFQKWDMERALESLTGCRVVEDLSNPVDVFFIHRTIHPHIHTLPHLSHLKRRRTVFLVWGDAVGIGVGSSPCGGSVGRGVESFMEGGGMVTFTTRALLGVGGEECFRRVGEYVGQHEYGSRHHWKCILHPDVVEEIRGIANIPHDDAAYDPILVTRAQQIDLEISLRTRGVDDESNPVRIWRANILDEITKTKKEDDKPFWMMVRLQILWNSDVRFFVVVDSPTTPPPISTILDAVRRGKDEGKEKKGGEGKEKGEEEGGGRILGEEMKGAVGGVEVLEWGEFEEHQQPGPPHARHYNNTRTNQSLSTPMLLSAFTSHFFPRIDTLLSSTSL